MSEALVQIDEFVIDELVCGNLRGEEYRRVLRALDAQPERWRDCALAFLQEQAWAEDLKKLANVEFDMAAESSDVANKSVESVPENVVASANLVAPRSSSERSLSRLRWMHRFTSIAALFLVSFTIGWFGSGLRGTTSVTNRDEANSAVLDRGLVQNTTPDAARSATASQTPLSSDNLQFVSEPFVSIDREMPDWLRQMERDGRVKIESYDALMPMKLVDGSSAVVPVQQYRVKPVIYSY